MWRLLYPFRTGGFHFRKQVQIGPYFADIACHHARLVIELDGDTHGVDAAVKHDAARDAYLRSRGYLVLRFANREVMTNPEGVFRVVSDTLSGAHPSPRSTIPSPT
jgi:very-short-patch-repair endonuclease